MFNLKIRAPLPGCHGDSPETVPYDLSQTEGKHARRIVCVVFSFLFIFCLFVEMASDTTTDAGSIASTTASPTTTITTTTESTTVPTTTINDDSTTATPGKAFSLLYGLIKFNQFVNWCFWNDDNMEFLLNQCYVYGSFVFR